MQHIGCNEPPKFGGTAKKIAKNPQKCGINFFQKTEYDSVKKNQNFHEPKVLKINPNLC